MGLIIYRQISHTIKSQLKKIKIKIKIKIAIERLLKLFYLLH